MENVLQFRGKHRDDIIYGDMRLALAEGFTSAAKRLDLTFEKMQSLPPIPRTAIETLHHITKAATIFAERRGDLPKNTVRHGNKLCYAATDLIDHCLKFQLRLFFGLYWKGHRTLSDSAKKHLREDGGRIAFATNHYVVAKDASLLIANAYAKRKSIRQLDLEFVAVIDSLPESELKDFCRLMTTYQRGWHH